MAKRTWAEASVGEGAEAASTDGHHLSATDGSTHHLQRRNDSFVLGDSAQNMPIGLDGHDNGQQRVPAISRRVKACAACRKQKVGC